MSGHIGTGLGELVSSMLCAGMVRMIEHACEVGLPLFPIGASVELDDESQAEAVVDHIRDDISTGDNEGPEISVWREGRIVFIGARDGLTA